MIGTDSAPGRLMSISMISILLIQVFSSQVALIMISQHDELLFSDKADQTIMKRISDLPPGSIVYSENTHWGYLYDFHEGIGLTSFPSLGLMDSEKSIQAESTWAIKQNDVDTLRRLGVTHAYTDPMGEMNIIISTSPWWRVIAQEDGTRLWALRNTLGVNSESHFIEIDSGELRTDPWKDLRHSDLLDEKVTFLTKGSVEMEELPDRLRGLELNLNLIYCQGPGVTTSMFDTISDGDGCGMLTTVVDSDWDGKVTIDVEGGGSPWLNPLGLSGRSDRIIDETGSYLYLIELRPK